MGEVRAPGGDDATGACRLLLCDDAFAFSLLFRRWMSTCGVTVIAETDNAQDAVTMAAELQPDVIVIDHLLNDVTSEEVAPRLREAAPGAKLLLISGMPEQRLRLL